MSKIKKTAKHLQHYLPLVSVLVAGVIGFVLFSYDKSFQAMVLVATALSYVVWGVVHHYIHDDLDLMVVVEYVVLATLGLVIVFSLLFRA